MTQFLARYEGRVLRYRKRVVCDAIRVSREGGNLLLSVTVNVCFRRRIWLSFTLSCVPCCLSRYRLRLGRIRKNFLSRLCQTVAFRGKMFDLPRLITTWKPLQRCLSVHFCVPLTSGSTAHAHMLCQWKSSWNGLSHRPPLPVLLDKGNADSGKEIGLSSIVREFRRNQTCETHLLELLHFVLSISGLWSQIKAPLISRDRPFQESMCSQL